MQLAAGRPSFPGPSETRPHLCVLPPALKQAKRSTRSSLVSDEADLRRSSLPKLALKPWSLPVPEGFLLVNAQVVSAAAGQLMPGKRTVKVVKGVVESVNESKADDLNVAQAKGLKVVDLEGAFVCPGLIDAHVHVTAVPGVATMADLVRTPTELVHLRTTYVLKEMLLRGFTTVRDTGGATKPLALSIEEGLLQGPRLFQCGKALSQTGGHGDFTAGISGGAPTGCCAGHAESLGRTVDGVPEVLRAVREELKAGADFIKVMAGGGVASETDAIDSVQYSSEEIQAITKTAKQMGNKMVTAHAYTVESIRHAVENGVTGIEHGNLLDEETAKYMAERGVYLTPTLSCYGAMVRPPFASFLTPDGQVKNAQVMNKGLEALVIAEKAGVTVCYGSDLLTSMHALQTEEFAVRAEVLDSPTILRHATINPAKMLKQEGKLGVVAPGSFADLLILNANPLDNIKVLDRPELYLKAIMKGGRVYGSTLDGLPDDKRP